MDYEKKYKDALERARQVHKYSSDLAEIKRMEDIFPELADFYSTHHTSQEELLAWLEKQGGIDNCPLECSTNTVMTDSKKNQVEPKFKVGDWIARGNVKSQIIGIEDDKYCFDGYKIRCSTIDKNYHLWTIQDAKDGDVLAAQECYAIFKEIDGLNIKCYCTYHYMGFNPSFHINTLQNKTAFQPATKEQRDLLFQKLNDAGYGWDAEKKELKKIEQKPVIDIDIPFGAKDSELIEASYYIPEGFHAEIEGNNVVIKKGEQKPAWSDEDETGWTNTMIMIKECASNHYTKDSIKLVVDWLESIKERIGE